MAGFLCPKCRNGWTQPTWARRLCPFCENDTLKARVEELETANHDDDNYFEGQLRIAQQRLRDVVNRAAIYAEHGTNDNDKIPQENLGKVIAKEFIKTAGYVRCECGGSGEIDLHGPDGCISVVDCPCVANGTTGWREQ